MRSGIVVAVLVVVSGCSLWPFGRAPQPADPQAVVEALRAGGYVIYLRHAGTEFFARDKAPVVLEDCATQRNLSAGGREEARAIGRGFARLLIPVGEVRSSPYCRCADTARLAFDRVLLDADLEPIRQEDEAARDKSLAALAHLLGTAPPPGTNTVLVGHAENLSASGEPSLDAGEAAVFKPLQGGGHQLITRVVAEAWSDMPSPPAASSGPSAVREGVEKTGSQTP
jgi:phosphohistidine phosphatase SixA